MTIWYWGDGSKFEHYYEPPQLHYVQPLEFRRKTKKEIERLKAEEQDYAQIESALRSALEEVSLNSPEYLMRLMEAPEGTPTVWQRGKRTTSEPRSDYDSWKPNYHWED